MTAKAANLVAYESTGLRLLRSAGVIRPYPLPVLVGIARTLRRWRRGSAGGFATVALRFPERAGLVDELPRNATGKVLKRKLVER